MQITRLSKEAGVTATIIALMMPLVIGILGLCVDGSVVIYHRIKLEVTAEAAAFSSMDAYDRTVWATQQKVVLNEWDAKVLAEKYLRLNAPGAELKKYTIPENLQNECLIEVQMRVPLFFLKVFGYPEAVLSATSSASAY